MGLSTERIVADTIVYVIAGTWAVVMFMYHAFLHYQDFYTEERKPVSYRRRPPSITPIYKLVGYVTLIQVFFTVMIQAGTILLYAADNDKPNMLQYCDLAVVLCTSGMLTKLFIYYAYELRLYLVYQGTKYERKKCTRILLPVILTIWGLLMVVWSLEGGGVSIIGAFPTWMLDGRCEGIPQAPYLLSFLGFDFGCGLMYVIFFIIPIRDVIRSVQGSKLNVQKQSKLSKKMIAVGLKVTILSAVVWVSTLVNFVIFGATGLPLINIDYCVNSLCLILMTPYYPDHKYFYKWCKCCISCCDRNGFTKSKELMPPSSPSETDQLEASAKSMDSSAHSKQSTQSAGSAGSAISSGSAMSAGSAASAVSSSGGISSVDTQSAVRQGAQMGNGNRVASDETELAGVVSS